MPLIKSASKKAFGKNIAKEIEAGKPKNQAVAIAYSEKRQAKRSTSDGHMVHREVKKMEKDEKKGIKEYSELAKKSKGKAKKVYKKILPDEKKHLKELKKI